MKSILAMPLLLVLALAHAVAAPLSASDSQAISTSLDQANAAMLKRDANALAGLMFERVFDLTSGDDDASSLATFLKDLDAKGHKVISYAPTISDSTVEAGPYLVCVVREVIDFELAGTRRRTNGYTLAVRNKAGGPWKLIGGQAISKKPEALAALLPGLPGDFQLPEYSTKLVIAGPPADELAKQIAARGKFPMKVDELTELDSVQGKEDTLTYNFSISRTLEAAQRQQLSQAMRSGFVQSLCGSANYRTLMKGGYSIRLNYDFGNAEDDLHVVMKPADCPQ